MSRAVITLKRQSEQGRFRNPLLKSSKYRLRRQNFYRLAVIVGILFFSLFPALHITHITVDGDSAIDLTNLEDRALIYPLTTHLLMPVARRVREVSIQEGLGQSMLVSRKFFDVIVHFPEPVGYIYLWQDQSWNKVSLPYFTTHELSEEEVGQLVNALSEGRQYIIDNSAQIILEHFDISDIDTALTVWNKLSSAGIDLVILIEEPNWIRARTMQGIDLYIDPDNLDIAALRSIWATRADNAISSYIDLRFEGRAYTR